MRTLTAEEAAAEIRAVDTFGMPLGPGQPVALLEAMGAPHRLGGPPDLRRAAERAERRLHPSQRPLPERLLRPARAVAAGQRGQPRASPPADFRRFVPILEVQAPRVMATAAALPDADGWCSLSLHAGRHGRRAAPGRGRPRSAAGRRGQPGLFPRTVGLGEHRHALHVDEIDVLIETRPARRSCSMTRHRPRSNGRSPSTSAPSCPTAPRSRPASAPSPRWSPRCSPRATAATTASTPRCSPPASCACTRRARSPTRRASSTACPWSPSPPGPPSSTTGWTGTRRWPSSRSTS